MIDAPSFPRSRGAAVARAIGLAAPAGAQAPGDVDWPVYLGAGSSQYSELAEIFASGGSKLFALDADTGTPIPTFGLEGSIDLHDGLDAGRDVSDLFVISNTPGVVYQDAGAIPEGG